MLQTGQNAQKAIDISRCLQLAILLEVSADKPGNVNFSSSFEGTRKEHFLASAIAAGPIFQKAAKMGIQILEGKRELSEAGLGELVEQCTRDVMEWQHGGNTILGTIMLFIPISIAAGITHVDEIFRIDLKSLRKNIDKVIRASTAIDAVHLYNAIDIAMPNGLNQVPDLNVNDHASKQRLLAENITLRQVFDIAKSYDDICSEWINNYPITFDEAYPYLIDQIVKTDQNTAVINTFLKILAQHPDTFIARKVGDVKAKEVTLEAKKVFDLGGAATLLGRVALKEFDQYLRKAENHYNPGTTADITAATLALCTLNGYRP